MRSLASVSAVDEVLDTVLQQPSLLFTDEWVRGSFLPVDVQSLRSASHTVSIPPPGSLGVDMAAEHVCRIQVDGQDCGAAFDTLQALSMHWAKSKKLGHAKRFAAFLTYSNQCILCCNYYASRCYAIRHLQRSLATGWCNRTKGSHTVLSCMVPPSYHCQLCDRDFDSEDAARFHFTALLPQDLEVEL